MAAALHHDRWMTTAGTQIAKPVDILHGHAKRVVRKAGPWIVRLGRFGLAAKGVVYLILGSLALQAGYQGRSRDVTDAQGAFVSLLRQPFGTLMLGILAAGLMAYMLWRVCQAALNPDDEPHNFSGWSKRVFRLSSGLVYGGLSVVAIRLLAGIRSHHHKPSDWTAMVMSHARGRWLVAAAGVCIAGYGLFRIYKALRGELKRQLILDGYAAHARAWIVWLGRLGQAARGVIFVVIGTGAYLAGLHTNPAEAQGVAEALRTIATAPYGPYLLAAVAAGLIAYGLFQFVEAIYRRIRPE